MKKTILIFIFILSLGLQSTAQDRSGMLSFTEHSVGFSTGIDYAILPLQLHYRKGIKLGKYKHPLILGSELSIPIFSFDLNDVKIKLTTNFTLLRAKNFEMRTGINPVFVNTKTQTERMSSLGADFHYFIGFTNKRWNTGLELTFNQIFSTFIKHSEKYRTNVLESAQDGWYKNTAGNFRIGGVINYRVKKFDIYINAGISRTGSLKRYLFVPSMYTQIGTSFRFN